MKKFVFLFIFLQVFGLITSNKESKLTIKLPDKNGYQSFVAGTDKHKYGYELKENKHFHHTTTEKDGVRLGCYGYELEGKKYSTQYVADSRGYRIVSTQDLITVYPKSGGTRKASFVGDFDEDPAVSENIRYFFPSGCKGIDVLIDNSSRLRSLASDPYAHIRLPVTLKPQIQSDEIENHVAPPDGYHLPGPQHIYAPNQLQTAATKPPVLYLPPTNPPNVYLPPTKPTDPPNVYLPPVKPEDPPNVYLPPVNSESTVAPETETDPPATPPEVETNPPPELISEIIPPPEPTENESCPNKCCEETAPGKFVIPIPLKSTGCCRKYAQLILPVKGFDEAVIQKLAAAITQEIDGTKLLADIFSNLV